VLPYSSLASISIPTPLWMIARTTSRNPSPEEVTRVCSKCFLPRAEILRAGVLSIADGVLAGLAGDGISMGSGGDEECGRSGVMQERSTTPLASEGRISSLSMSMAQSGCGTDADPPLALFREGARVTDGPCDASSCIEGGMDTGCVPLRDPLCEGSTLSMRVWGSLYAFSVEAPELRTLSDIELPEEPGTGACPCEAEPPTLPRSTRILAWR
jgi:hypothetical protein